MVLKILSDILLICIKYKIRVKKDFVWVILDIHIM